MNEIRKSLISEGPTSDKAIRLKCEATETFNDAKFELHKWHLNEKQLETSCEDYEPSFAKEQLENELIKGECKLLGVSWEKVDDTLHVCFPAMPAKETKRGILTNLAKVYDLLRTVSTAMLEGNLLYRELCIQKNAWDAPLPEEIADQWRNWVKGLPEAVSVKHSIPLYNEEIDEIQLHAFGDANDRGVCAAVYAVVTQASGVSQVLVTAKCCLAKQQSLV